MSTSISSTTLNHLHNVMTKTAVSEPLLSDYGRLIFQWVVFTIAILIMSSFGIVTNIINIICFVRQGLRDSVNVSLLGLAISDLGCLMTSFVFSICFNPAFTDLPFDPIEFVYLSVGWLHVVFSGLTSCITAIVTLERCLCVTMPLKVRDIISPKRVTVVIFCVFGFLACGVAPMYYANRFVWQFSPERNKTIIKLVYTSDRAIFERISVGICSVFLPFTAFFTIIICTTILVIQLQSKAKWRQSCSAPGSGQMLSGRDQRITKMVVIVSTVFIICFSPICISCVVMIMVPGLAVDGQNNIILYVLTGCNLLLECTNSSSNIFIYFQMSRRYRSVLKQMFFRGQSSR